MALSSLLSRLKSNGIHPKSILDIGANKGQFAKECKRVWSSSKLFSVEANPECIPYLDTIGIDYSIQVLSDSEKDLTFFTNPKDDACSGASYLKENTHHYDDSEGVTLHAKPLSDCVYDEFEFIKIDTQGSEIDIIRGGLDIVQKAKYVLMEVSIQQYNHGAPLKPEVISYMESIGFGKYSVVDIHRWNCEVPRFPRGSIIQEDILFVNTMVG